MITDENLPEGWTAASERTQYDEVMDREFESRRYGHESGDVSVSINEVQEPEEFEGWGYQVTVEHDSAEDPRTERLGLFEDLAGAREVAIDYMAERSGG